MDAEDVADHARRIPQGIDFTLGAVIPVNGDFGHVILVAFGEKKQFDVKRPAE